jgi:hypothetical protein
MLIDKPGALIKKRKRRWRSNNPYYCAAGIIYRRLIWDLTIESWRSRKKLRAIKNKYYKKKAVIVCNGPSLLKSDLKLLKNIYTFGLNKINLLFDTSEFRPSCIVAVNPFVIEQNADFYNHTKIPLFLDSKGMKDIRSNSNVIYLHSNDKWREFAQDCTISIYDGKTVTFVAMQLAFHLGFFDVALIGCDHYFYTKGVPNKTVVSGKKDPNHFDPKYFSGGEKWQLPDLLQSEVAYTMAKNNYEENGRRIVNATEGGKLDIFDRINLIDFIGR